MTARDRLSRSVSRRIAAIERVINEPEPRLVHTAHRWENSILIPYSDLAGSVASFACRAGKVLIVTGFYIPAAFPPAAETDGPPGALILAEGLRTMGYDVVLLSDRYAFSTLVEGLRVLDIPSGGIQLVEWPMEHDDEGHPLRQTNDEDRSRRSFDFTREFLLRGPGRDLAHVIYIERVGPNHTLASFLGQDPRNRDMADQFQAVVPPHMQNRCLNSRLDDITRFTGKTHLIMELRETLGLHFRSTGIGDRGNEIGAGRIPWQVFFGHSPSDREALYACRVATDHFIAAGVSNWGAYGLLAGIALARGMPEVLERVTPAREMEVLDHLVHHGPSVDGIVGKQQHSVDGIPFHDYIKIVERVTEIALDRNDPFFYT